ncbi:MAG: hypothetical protein IJ564_05095 [Alphaproteobacteria bacterium]|nr:hypothetical protein [Alphaproteobacteria bacterium]
MRNRRYHDGSVLSHFKKPYNTDIRPLKERTIGINRTQKYDATISKGFSRPKVCLFHTLR